MSRRSTNFASSSSSPAKPSMSSAVNSDCGKSMITYYLPKIMTVVNVLLPIISVNSDCGESYAPHCRNKQKQSDFRRLWRVLSNSFSLSSLSANQSRQRGRPSCRVVDVSRQWRLLEAGVGTRSSGNTHNCNGRVQQAEPPSGHVLTCALHPHTARAWRSSG